MIKQIKPSNFMINPQKAQKIRRLLICLIPTAVLTASGSTVSVSIIKIN